ncbi:MAG: AGE family epimerase/isomerase [Niabella sp.]
MLIPADMSDLINIAVLKEELEAILQYWTEHTIDKAHGGFIGEIGADNQLKPGAQKGLVLNSRILWSFSAAAIVYPGKNREQMAHRAYRYIRDHFIDPVHGGAYWSLTETGKKQDGKKQIYGIAFCIYGLSEYVKLTASIEALQLAKRLFFPLKSMRQIRTKKAIAALRFGIK